MPTRHFKSKEAYRKWRAWKHIHIGKSKHKTRYVVIAGRRKRVHHRRR